MPHTGDKENRRRESVRAAAAQIYRAGAVLRGHKVPPPPPSELSASARAFINTSFHRAANPITQNFIQRLRIYPTVSSLSWSSWKKKMNEYGRLLLDLIMIIRFEKFGNFIGEMMSFFLLFSK